MKRTAAVVLMLIVAAASFITVRGNSSVQDRNVVAAPSSAMHLAGTDELGRDRASRTASAVLFGVAAAVPAAAACTVFALLVSLCAAFAPSFVGSVLLYCTDIFLMVPWLYALMMLRSALPLNVSSYTSATLTFVVIAVLGWPLYVRSLHQRVLRLRGEGWWLHARASGLSSARIARVYLLPHLRPVYLTQFLICIPAFIVAEANLGVLGMGVSAPLVSWGSLLQELANSSQRSATYWTYLPLAVLAAVLFSFELLISED